mmetsp:Transcript_12754/g.21215  ORF Transcript_12754/g.21215 Transcript_12754/m.21215 type:complete len:799 (+) Transcript_12754:1698-4094(+)
MTTEVAGGLLTPGDLLEFRVEFTVVSNGGTLTRRSIAKQRIHIQPPMTPSLSLSAVSSLVPLSGVISVTATAISAEIPANALRYEWAYTDLALNSSSALPSAQSASLVSPAASVYSGASVASQAISIAVTVTDLGSLAQAVGALSITIAPPPRIVMTSVSPTSGVGFRDRFTISSTAQSGYLPLLYQSSYNTSEVDEGASPAILLSSFTSSSVLSTVLPPGTLTILVEIKDSIGGGAKLYSSPIVVSKAEETISDVPSGATEAERQCNETSGAVQSLRSVVKSLEVVPNSDELPLIDAISQSLEILMEEGRLNELIRTAQYCLEVLRTIDASSQIGISDCRDNVLDAAANGVVGTSSVGELTRRMHLLTSSSQTATTIGSLANEIWSTVSMKLEDSLNSADKISVAGEQGTQIMVTLTKSEAVDSSSQSIERLANTTNALMEAATPAELVSTKRGANTASTLSNLLDISSRASSSSSSPPSVAPTRPPARTPPTSPTSPTNQPTASETRNNISCSSVDNILHLVDVLMQRSGQALAADAPGVEFSTDNFEAKSMHVFSDAPASAEEGGVRVVTPSFPSEYNASSGGISRPTRIFSISTFSSKGIAGKCRDPKAGANPTGVSSVESNISSINFLTAASSAQPGRSLQIPRNRFVRILIPISGVVASSTARREECTGKGVLKRQKVLCGFWNTTTMEWSDEGCSLNRTFSNASSSYAECVCNHLTEFAMLSRQLSDDQCIVTEVSEEEKWVFLAFCVVYLIVLACTSKDLWRMYKGVWIMEESSSERMKGLFPLNTEKYV